VPAVSQEDTAEAEVIVEVEAPLAVEAREGSSNSDYQHLSSGFNKVPLILKQSYCDLI
jgi:hypothetical protein